MTSDSPPRHPVTPSLRHALPWAIFLASSWTWCIGMFLPVLLVRDYGVWAWVVFAIPNVIGAAAMGWTVRDAEHSRRIVESHRRACWWFSLITIVFQLYFAAWFIGLLSPAWFFISVATAAFIWIVAPNRVATGLVTSLAVYAISLGCIVLGIAAGVIPKLPPATAPASLQIIALAVVCAFGFALCPYFDLTFHRARQAAVGATQSRLAFGLGFGGFFLLMILFTLGYSGVVVQGVAGAARWMLLVHLSFQLGLTGGLHIREIETTKVPSRTLCAAVLIVLLLAVLAMQRWHHRGIELGETIYRLFMSFYGLVFPAYAWLCVVPTWRDPQPAAKRSLLVFAASTLLAAPFYYLAFVEGKMEWVVAGVAIVLASRLVLHHRREKPALA